VSEETPTTPTPPAAAAAEAAPPAAAPSVDPMAARLERERRATIRALTGNKPPKGVPTERILEEEAGKREKRKQELRELRSKAAELEAKAANAEKQLEALKAYAQGELASLSEERRKQITDLAGDDPAEQLRLMAAARVLAPSAAATTAPAATAHAAVTPPATTAPPAAPAPAATQAEMTLAQRYEAARSTGDNDTQRIVQKYMFLSEHGNALLQSIPRR